VTDLISLKAVMKTQQVGKMQYMLFLRLKIILEFSKHVPNLHISSLTLCLCYGTAVLDTIALSNILTVKVKY
jgi:hypothetical protein